MKNLDDISEVISRDNGKTRIDALATEVLTSTMSVTYYCKNARKFLKDRSLPNGNIMFINKRSKIARVPFGVVGIISPWNYPFAIPFSEIVMALLAGNAVIFKAASETQVVGHALRRCIDAAGLPRGIFNYINMPGSVAGDAFLEAGIDKLFFTGSVKTGMYLMKKASETLTPVSLELGGNDPMIVCADADLKRAATGALWAGYQNAGQSCGGVERIYVEREVYDKFLEILKKEIESTRVGYDTDHNVDVGAMTTQRQIATVHAHIADALKKGAKIYAQSKAPKGGKGQFLPCSVLVDVNHDMLVMKDETFGPEIGRAHV
jgi:succinate-semialdehyde dehydrogenase/glutarate-semialdehyde dehydrogenase